MQIHCCYWCQSVVILPGPIVVIRVEYGRYLHLPSTAFVNEETILYRSTADNLILLVYYHVNLSV